jgi:hypothetical protein
MQVCVPVWEKMRLQLTTFNLQCFNLVRAMNEFAMTVVMRWADLDANQHVKNTAYSEWASYVRFEWLASCGFDLKKLMELQFSPVIFEDSTRYVREIFAGEHIGINIELVRLKQDGSRWHARPPYMGPHCIERCGLVAPKSFFRMPFRSSTVELM